MKTHKILACAVLAGSMAVGGQALAKNNAGGFVGPGPDKVSAAQAKDMKDDAKVMLEGNIVKHLGGENYLFQDESGTIIVEIDADEWQGQQITPEDTVQIHGEVDKDFFGIEIDVDRIVKK